MNQNEVIRAKLISAVTQYDMKQSKRRGYNMYALAQYFEAVDRAIAKVEQGATLASALESTFNDRVLTAVQKAVK